jgi:dTDP-4-amino-4,6-dideoxygalactose transaminase
VVEDAAHALGAVYRGRRVGTLGDATCLSFYVTKNITTAEGGALLTAGEEWAKRARLLALHGMDRDAWKRYSDAGSWSYEVAAPGYKYNLPDLAAALGLEQLRRLPDLHRRRRELARRYRLRLAGNGAVESPVVREDVESAHHLYPIRLRLDRLTIDRARFIDELRAENIATSVHFIPVHLLAYYRDRFGYSRGAFPVAENAYDRLVSLPLYPSMSDDDVDDVAAAVDKITACFSR